MLLLATAPTVTFAQAASISETNAVARIAECLIVGPPSDWKTLYMVVELAEPGAQTGQVRYLVARESAPDKQEPYVPCDLKKPAQLLIDSRKWQVPERQSWTGARLTLHENGNFELNYDYPK